MYLRKSRQDEELINATIDETLAKHEKLLKDYAAKAQINIDEVFKELASAGDIDGRPVFNRLLLDIERGLFDAVLVVDIDRLTRGNAVDLERIKNTFKIMNCKIITPLKVYDPTNEDDEFFLDFSMFISARELKLIRKRMVRGKISAMEQGYYTGSALPFGFSKYKSDTGKGWILCPHPEEANLVRYVFEQYANGERPVNIISHMNESGMLRRGSKWNYTKLFKTLKNRLYIGDIVMYRSKFVETIENGEVKRKRGVKPEEVRYVKGKHEPLISQDIWDIVEAKIGSAEYLDRSSKNRQMVNPLSGLIYCPHCGSAIIRGTSPVLNGREEYLRCRTIKCPTKSTPLLAVEKRIIDELHGSLDELNIFLDNYEEEYEIKKANRRNELELLEMNLAKRRNMLAKACEMLEEGIYTIEMFKARQSEINGQIEHIEASIAECKTRQEHEEVEIVRKLVPNIKYCLEAYYTLDPKSKNKLLHSIIDRIVYIRDVGVKFSPIDNFEIDIKLKI